MKTNNIDRDYVARLAGVSAATVSRVFNNPNLVSGERRKAVLEAADKLGYRPNKAASSLRRRSSGEICFVEESFGPNYFWGSPRIYPWYYAEALRGVVSVIDQTPFTLSIVRIERTGELKALIERRRPDGIIFFDAVRTEIAESLHDLGLPAVIGHHVEDFPGVHRCMTDNRNGARLAGAALRAAGYRKPVYIGSEIPGSYVHEQRYQGFVQGFEGIPVPLLTCEVGKDGGVKAAESLVTDIRAGNIDSVGVVNDYTAIGVILGLYKHGIRIPGDIAMTGYDNLPFSEALPFKLATVDLRIGEIYAEAATGLSSLLTGTSGLSPGDLLNRRIEPVYVPGDSVPPVP